MIASSALVLLPLLAQPSTFAAETTYESPIRAVLEGESRADVALWDLDRWREPLEALYARQSHAPLWFVDERLTPAGRTLVRQLQDVERRGLLVTDYDGPKLAELTAGLDFRPNATAAAIARLDVALSVNVARLASDLHQGRVDPEEVGYDLDVRRPAFDAVQVVTTLATAPDVIAALDALEPQFRHYSLLKIALAHHGLLAMQPRLTQLPPLPRSSVRAGEPYVGAPALRRLLTAIGDLPESPVSGEQEKLELDPELVAALVRFQARHGLDVDGTLGDRTYRALTTPIEERIRQIVLSLERLRWLPPKLESPPIIVNIPQFRLFAFRTTQDFAEDILQMDVIVGSTFNGRHTPVFAADMRYVVLNPYWDVPRSILLKEMLPAIKADPGWLAKNGYEMVLGAADGAISRPADAGNVQLLVEGELRVRQKPGPMNALGQVKFMFPNRHNVYMHDTPARELFARSRRAFSHGCIRVSDPITLLAHVLGADRKRTSDRLEKALRGNTPVVVRLAQPIRVYIVYGTALATEAGQTLFFDDIYDQDSRLTALLEARRSRSFGHTKQ
jgi:murein L,D-transpeptidase YcbB/YkuD